MADFPPPSPPEPPSPPPTENVYTPSQFEKVKGAFKHFLFRIIPKELRPVFLILHDAEDNPYPSVDLRGRVLVRDDLIESEQYDLKRRCTNDGSNAGNHSVKIEPAAGSILFIRFVAVKNEDAAARGAHIYGYTAGAVIISELNAKAALAAAGIIIFPTPTHESNRLALTPPLILTDAFEVGMGVAAVAVSEESSYFMEYYFVGTAPTITETGPTGSVFSDVS